MSRYVNKRIQYRGKGGQFRKVTMADVGIGGVCQKCRHFMLWHYDGDPRDTLPNPRSFRYRCFTCEPLTEGEQTLAAEIEAAKPKKPGIFEILNAVVLNDANSDN